MTPEQAVKNLKEIIELSRDEINKKDENLTAILDLTDLESLDLVLSVLKEKDKQIELLIRELYKRTHISTKCYLQDSVEECMQYKNCYECIRKYFENKVKEVQ